MKNIITIIAVLSFGLSYGQWTKTYGGLDIEYGKSVQQTVDGGFVFTGSTKSYGNGDYDVWLIKTDNNGDSLWTKTFGGINNDQGWDIKQTTDGGFIISGETIKSFYPDIWLIKTDNNGDTLWTNTFGGWDHEKAYCVNQTSDKGFIITGTSNSFGSNTYSDLYLIKTDSNGTNIWSKVYGGNSTDKGRSVLQTKDGGFIVTGITNSFGNGSYDLWLMKTDHQGDTIWTKTFGGAGFEEGFSIKETTDSGYIITGSTTSYGNGSYDLWIIKTDSQGDSIWTKAYGGTDFDQGDDIVQTSDGGFIITGLTKSFGNGSFDLWLLKTDYQGDTLWTKTLGGADADYGKSVQQTLDGGYIITGNTEINTGNYDLWIIKTDSLGDTTSQQITSLKESTFLNEMEIYPNPFSISTTIELPSEPHTLTIYDITGNKVREEQVSGTTTIIERGDLKPGVYLLEVRSEHQTYSGKLVVE
jgi:hypothetical protein